MPKLMATIPDHIVLDILVRLPVKSISRFRCLDKNLSSSLINDPHFIQTHLDRARTFQLNKFGLIISLLEHGNRHDSSFMHFYVVSGIVGSGISNTEFSVSVPVPFDSYHVLPSCNSLVCFYGSHCGGIHVCNPATRKFVTLPANGFQSLTCGFGFDESINKHKVIKFSKPFRIDDEIGVSDSPSLEIFTIGDDTNSWRTIRFQPRFRFLYHQPPVFADGFFYWVTADKNSSTFSITSFNVQQEMFGTISPPESIMSKNWRMLHLVELGGKLSIVDFGGEEKKRMDLWIFYEGSWVREVTIIHPSEPIDVIRPVAVLAGGEILMHGYVKGMGDFSMFDPKLCTFTKVEIGEIPSQYFHASSYVESLAITSSNFG